LADDEVDLVRLASRVTVAESRLPAIVALAEASATTTEIAAITAADVDLDAGTVQLPGSRLTRHRVAPLTDWGRIQIRRRVDTVGDRRLTYDGHGDGSAGQRSVSVGLGRLLNAAGLGSEPDVGLGSIRAATGRRVFADTGRIEAAANTLGCRSLDIAARLIGWEWTKPPR
jgi:hypothetical protein